MEATSSMIKLMIIIMRIILKEAFVGLLSLTKLVCYTTVAHLPSVKYTAQSRRPIVSQLKVIGWPLKALTAATFCIHRLMSWPFTGHMSPYGSLPRLHWLILATRSVKYSLMIKRLWDFSLLEDNRCLFAHLYGIIMIYFSYHSKWLDLLTWCYK